MDFFEVVKRRHSYRGAFLSQKVPRDDLTTIVAAGINAPSGKNQQTTDFIIIDDPQLLAKIRSIVNKPVLETAPAMILVCSRSKIAFEGHSFEKEDYSAATQNMLLAITALGYASVWLDGVLRLEEKAKKLERLFNLPEEVHASVLLPVGIPAEAGQPSQKKPFEGRAGFNRYMADN